MGEGGAFIEGEGGLSERPQRGPKETSEGGPRASHLAALLQHVLPQLPVELVVLQVLLAHHVGQAQDGRGGAGPVRVPRRGARGGGGFRGLTERGMRGENKCARRWLCVYRQVNRACTVEEAVFYLQQQRGGVRSI